MKKEKQLIKAVHDDDLIDFLKSIDEYEKLTKKELRCCYCNSIINLDNIYSVFPRNKEVAYCCNSEFCQEKLLKEGR